MTTLSNRIGFAFDLIISPFKDIDPLWSMAVISALTGVLMVLVYRYTSNQVEIRNVKDRIKAHFLAIMLYKDSLKVVFSSIGGIFSANLRYVRLNFAPLLFMMAPVGLLLVQMNCWYGYKPFEPGDSVLVKARLAKVVNLAKCDLSLSAADGLEILTPPLRIPSQSEANWRLVARKMGQHEVKVRVDGQEVTKTVIVSDRMERLSLLRHASDFWDGLLYPGERAIPPSSPVQSIEVDYQVNFMDLFGWRVHWIVPYLALSVFFGLTLKGVFKVQI